MRRSHALGPAFGLDHKVFELPFWNEVGYLSKNVLSDSIFVPNLIWVQRYTFQKCDKVSATYYIVHKTVIFYINRI